MNISRADLYRLVWTYPVSNVAAKLRMSGVALGKWCRKMGVPTPGTGHWARVRAGLPVTVPPLPPVENDLERSLMVGEEVEPDLLELLSGTTPGHVVTRVEKVAVKPESSPDELPHPFGAHDPSADKKLGALQVSRGGARRRARSTASPTVATTPAREAFENAAPSSVMSSLILLADEFAQRRKIEHFLALLEVEAARCDLSLNAAVISFVLRARRELSLSDPIERTLQTFRIA